MGMWKPRGQSAQPTPCPAGPAAVGELVTVDFSHQSSPAPPGQAEMQAFAP